MIDEIENLNRALNLKVHVEVEKRVSEWLQKAQGVEWVLLFEEKAKRVIELEKQCAGLQKLQQERWLDNQKLTDDRNHWKRIADNKNGQALGLLQTVADLEQEIEEIRDRVQKALDGPKPDLPEDVLEDFGWDEETRLGDDEE